MKILTALITFSVITGGWWFFQTKEARQLASTPLPGSGGPQGRCVLWFIGSSSIYRWRTLDRDMKPWIAHNRGIEGATFVELAPRFAADTETTAPEAIILYAGENDIAAGRTAQQAMSDLKLFLDDKTRKFRNTPVFVLSMKPSPTRWRFFAEQSRYNVAARALAEQRKDLTFVDTVPLLLVAGKPGDFYLADGIHMNEQGYKLWAGAVRRALDQALSDGKIRVCDPVFSGPGGPASPQPSSSPAAPSAPVAINDPAVPANATAAH